MRPTANCEAVSDSTAYVKQDTTYETSVTEARKSRSSRILDNLSLLHAEHVVKELFQLALEEKADVMISSGTLNSKCYSGQVYNLAEKLLQQGGKITAVVDDPTHLDIEGNRFAMLIANQSDEHLFALNTDRIDDEISHFCVVKGHAFRFETDHSLAKAKLSFNQADIAGDLSEEFEFYRANSTPIGI
ncbi:hypothetical protein [Aliiroseovarius crassostreae]|uniref:hypothetical protein n=1 Tax=Aliiroseovarius crassostreae TaxID=154981 RepID=UPI003C7E236B